ncbi:MAG: hypothetical protein ACI849_000896, partial [Patiriisocius sp.]
EGSVTGITGGTLIGGIYSGPNVTDGGNGQTFSFDATAAGVGTHTVTYTDPCTGTVAMATITVTDGVPDVSCIDVTLTLDAAGMAIYDPLASIPSTLAVVGGNNGSNNSGTTTMQVSITQTVNVSFDWLFESPDNAGFDDFGYTLNGAFTNLSNGAAYPASANSSLLLNNGDVFGFTVNTDDNLFGAATSSITNFSPGFQGQFAEANWIEGFLNSDGSTNFSGNISSTTITGDCGNPVDVTASQTVFTCNDIGNTIVTISADNGIGIGTCEATITIIAPTPTPCGLIAVNPKAYLQGAFLNPNMGEETLMRDDLRVANLVPTLSPYGDGLTCDISIFTPTGSNAIVDWVWLELRDAADRSIVVEGRSALLQRDGDIVDIDGTSAVGFNAALNNFYLLIQHRNHLSMLSSTALAMSGATTVDFSSNPMNVFGGNSALINVGGIFSMISGDAFTNGQIGNTDVSEVRPQVGASGYSKLDTNMNGEIQNSDINIFIRPNIGRGIQY